MSPKLVTTKNSIDKQSGIVTGTMHMISTQTNRQVTISPYVTNKMLVPRINTVRLLTLDTHIKTDNEILV